MIGLIFLDFYRLYSYRWAVDFVATLKFFLEDILIFLQIFLPNIFCYLSVLLLSFLYIFDEKQAYMGNNGGGRTKNKLPAGFYNSVELSY